MPDRRRLTQEERTGAARTALLDATMAVLAEEGYRRTTFSRIQDAAGISRGLVSYHFGSKLALIESVIHRVRDRYQADAAVRASLDLDGFDGLRNTVETYLERFGKDPRPAKVMLVLGVESIGEDPSLRLAMQQRFAEMREELGGFITKGLRDGTIRPDVEPDGTAAMLQGMIRGITLQYLVDPGGFDLAAARRAGLAAIDALAAPGADGNSAS